MMGLTQCGFALLLIASFTGAAPYSKYGRTCKDIGCLTNEICVMTEDPCTIYSQDQCGKYPTCKKATESGQQTCTTLICPSGQYCKTENGRPTCVNTVPGLGYDSAGVATINGQPTRTDDRHRDKPQSPPVLPDNNYDSNPYANANAPPVHIPSQNYPVNAGTNLGYPPYPSNTGTNSGSSATNLGYPSYPSNTNTNSGSSNTNLGYPAYPNQNRMPSPGQTYPQSNYPGYPQQYPSHPQQNGYPQQYPSHPQQNGYPQQYPSYPQQNGYPQQYPINTQNRNIDNLSSIFRRRNSGSYNSPAITLIVLSFGIVAKYFT